MHACDEDQTVRPNGFREMRDGAAPCDTQFGTYWFGTKRSCNPKLGKDSIFMLHFTCDLCGKQLGDQRFIVKLEVYPGFDPEEVSEEHLDADHLQEISQILHEMEESGKPALDDCGTKVFRYDLCPRCHKNFLKDPIGRDALRRLNFSEN